MCFLYVCVGSADTCKLLRKTTSLLKSKKPFDILNQRYLLRTAPPPGPGTVCIWPYLQASIVDGVPLALAATAAALLLLLSVGKVIMLAGNVALGRSFLDSPGLGNLLVVVDTAS